MKEFITQVTYLHPITGVDEVVAVFTYKRTRSENQTWSCRINKVSLKTAAELICTFFNSSHGEKVNFLELEIYNQELLILKSDTQNTPDYYLCSIASKLKIG